MLVSIVVPMYREAENVPALLGRIDAAMRGAAMAYEAIVVDDDSRDGTDRAVARAAAEGTPVRVITRGGERGLASAALRGFAEAAGDVLVCMDGDLSHPPEAIPLLVRALAGGAEFVIGSRYVPGGSTDDGWTVPRWINSKVATLLARPFTRVADPMAGFFALPREVFQRAERLNPVGYKIGLELLVKCKCRRIVEAPIHFASRARGRSKLTLRQQLLYLLHICRLARYRVG